MAMPAENTGTNRVHVDFRPRMNRTREEELGSLSMDGIRAIVDRWASCDGWSVEGGSGLGRYVHYLEGRGSNCVGIEVSREIVAKAKLIFSECDFVRGDVEKLPIRTESVTSFLSLGVIDHLSDPVRGLKEIFRTIRANGTLIITVPNKFSSWPAIRSHFQGEGRWDVGYEQSFSISGLREILEAAGFRICKIGQVLVISSLVRLLLFFVDRSAKES